MSVSNMGLSPYGSPRLSIKPEAASETAGPAVVSRESKTTQAELPALQISISREAWAAAKGMSSEQVNGADRVAREAAEVSRSQGFPQGKYDFSCMTGSQLDSVVGHLLVNEGVHPDDIRGLIDAQWAATTKAPEETHDFLSIIREIRDFEGAHGNALGAAQLQISLSYIESRLAGRSG